MEVLALVTARGGSKGLPRKNVHPFLGRPLIAWSIGAAKAARCVTRTVVTTDDAEIAAVSREWGAEVPFLRPAELAQDLTPDVPVFQHALRWLAEKEGYRPDFVVHLRPTSPLRPRGLIDDGVRQLIDNAGADSVRSVCIPPNNPFKMWRIVDGRLVPLVESGVREQYNQPRQVLPTVYWQIGALDVTRPHVILDKGSMTGDVVLPAIMETEHAVDIDDIHALRIAEDVCRRFGLEASL